MGHKLDITIGSSYERDGIVWTIVDEKKDRWIIRRVEPMELNEVNYNMGYITKEMYEGIEPPFNITEDSYQKHTPREKSFDWSWVN
jgi:hypothetical protein